MAPVTDLGAEMAQYRESLPEADARLLAQYRVADAVAGDDGRLLVRCTGDIIALSPPLIVDKAQIDQITGTLGEMIRATA